MTPDQLDIILGDRSALSSSPDTFATVFYETLFDLAPETRALFPSDMTAQFGKLTEELATLVEIATAWHRTGSLDRFVERAHRLGERHRGFGVTSTMYGPVGIALIAALRACIPDFDGTHERAWSTLYHLVADTMREGALGADSST